jgi:hypothetical protein
MVTEKESLLDETCSTGSLAQPVFMNGVLVPRMHALSCCLDHRDTHSDTHTAATQQQLDSSPALAAARGD